MKFIRDIISERADAKASGDGATAPIPLPKVEEAQKSPTGPGDGSVDRYADRTMTRLSATMSMDDDDIFERLLGDDAKHKAQAAQDDNVDDAFDDTNLFGDLDDDLDDEDPTETTFARAQPPAPQTQPETMVGSPDIPLSATPTPAAMPAPEQEPEPEQAKPQVRQDAVPEPASSPTAAPHGTAFAGIPGRSAKPATAEVDPGSFVAVPGPASGRSGRGAGRVKTRLLGFGAPEAPVHDPFHDQATTGTAPAPQSGPTFPVGWLVVIGGPGRGTGFALQSGVSQIGRGDDQAIRLDFGDTAISRSNHAAVAYDAEQGGFYLGHGGKANMVRLNDRPVLSTEELKSGDLIRIGETTMRFVAFCDTAFSWTEGGA